MADNEIKFVRVVKTPSAAPTIGSGNGCKNFWNFSNQLAEADTFEEVVRMAAQAMYGPTATEYDNFDDGIEQARDILKAEFSAVDLDRILPMQLADGRLKDEPPSEEDDGEVKIGMTGFTPPAELNAAHKYELRPILLSLSEINSPCLPTADRFGHCAGIARDELKAAKYALENEQLALMQGRKNFSDYPDPSSLILNGGQIKIGTRENRKDIVLNVVFERMPEHTPEIYKRLSRLLRYSPSL